MFSNNGLCLWTISELSEHQTPPPREWRHPQPHDGSALRDLALSLFLSFYNEASVLTEL